MEQIITSLLENDLYKFTMQQLALNQYPDVEVEYSFVNRGQTFFPKDFGKKLKAQINRIEQLKFKPDEIQFLRKNAPFLKESYLRWLSQFSPKAKHVMVIQSGGRLKIKINGPWVETIYWEVPLMAVISELYFAETGQRPEEGWQIRAAEKAARMKSNGVNFAEFGMRRRFSSAVQDEAVQIYKRFSRDSEFDGGFVGTSNVYLAYKHNVRMIGTMAHELISTLSGIHGPQSANSKMLETWVNEYNGDLGIALTDTFTTDVFLRDFRGNFARTFDGVRHDSGDPFEFTDTIVAHYESLGIDPMSKTIVFSDGLDADKAIAIAKYCRGKIKCSFGIGTNLSNDVGVDPLNIVIKVFRARKKRWPWIPVVKLSDEPGKNTGDPIMVKAVKVLMGIKEPW